MNLVNQHDQPEQQHSQTEVNLGDSLIKKQELKVAINSQDNGSSQGSAAKLNQGKMSKGVNSINNLQWPSASNTPAKAKTGYEGGSDMHKNLLFVNNNALKEPLARSTVVSTSVDRNATNSFTLQA